MEDVGKGAGKAAQDVGKVAGGRESRRGGGGSGGGALPAVRPLITLPNARWARRRD
ncbi:hypothetical protein Stsp01_53480 [Streptomyces sp. NBRC 13847]|nr:hypothetical protein Stsp01_53480 [Streptomyces sp. NBRC 13847]